MVNKIKKNNYHCLFVSYNGALEPILPSQGIPYLRELAKQGIIFDLLTFEKKIFPKNIEKQKKDLMYKQLKDYGIKWHWLRYHKKPKIISTIFDIFLCAIAIIYLVLSKKIRIIHIRGITLSPLICMLSKVLRIKFIFDMRGLLAEEYVGAGIWRENQLIFKIVKWVEKRILQSADAIVVLTHKHYLLNKNLHCLKRNVYMEVIPCCVDMRRFNPRSHNSHLLEHYGLNGKFIFMYPGKIGTFYLIDEMLNFFLFASNTIKETIFVILTQDNYQIILKIASAKGVSLEKIKIFTPTFEEIPQLLSLADVGIFFINPYKKFGSSPIKLGEFLASRVPVIINSGIGDTAEIVRENRVGVVIDKFTSMDYKKAVEDLFQLLSEGDSLKSRCRQTAEKYLSLELGVERYCKIYQNLTKNELANRR